jgi:hypothetical protein
LEPCPYDLVVALEGRMHRVQVKTTTRRQADTWLVDLSSGRSGRRTYDPDDVDAFFVIDGDLGYYLVPIAAVGGMHLLTLSAYEEFRVASSVVTWVASPEVP